MSNNLTIIGLGPGGIESLSIGTLETMKKAGKLMFRTGQHPVVAQLSEMGFTFTTFDELYEKSLDFKAVYRQIAQEVINSAKLEKTVFGVPGHPLVGEESVKIIKELAKENNIAFDIMPAMSFLDPVFISLNLDLSVGLKIIDGLSLVENGNTETNGFKPDPLIPNLIMQIYNSLIASDIKIALMDYYPDEHPIKVVMSAGVQGKEQVIEIPLYKLDRLRSIDHLTCVYIPPLLHSKTMVSRFPLDSLVNIMERLRSKVDGCPWDREQTHESLKKYLIEETYEVIEAIDEGNMYKICEELGDLLLQIVFHTQIASEDGLFDMNDVIDGISAKLIRRHPHVFGETRVKNSEEVSSNWESIKREELLEKGEIRKSILDGIPKSMPALIKSEKIQHKAAKVGFDWPDYRGALDKIVEELSEVKNAIKMNDPKQMQDEIGDLLFAVVNLARLLKIDPEQALSGTVQKFKERFSYMEGLARKSNIKLDELDLDGLDRLWDRAKIELKGKKN